MKVLHWLPASACSAPSVCPGGSPARPRSRPQPGGHLRQLPRHQRAGGAGRRNEELAGVPKDKLTKLRISAPA
jgi:hypothetical protein